MLTPEFALVRCLAIFQRHGPEMLIGSDVLYQYRHICKPMFRSFQGSGGLVAGGGDLDHSVFQIRVSVYSMFRQEIQCPCGLLQVVELRPLLIARRLLGLDAVFQINPQRDSLAFFRPPCDSAALDTLFDCFFGVGFTQRLASGEAFLSGGAERNKFARFDLIALRLHEPQKIVKVFGLRDGNINGCFELRFPACPFPLGVPFGVALALTLAGLYHGQSVFLAQPITGAPDVGIALFVGNVLALIDHIHGTKNQMIMDVALVYMGSQHIGIFPLQHFVGKLFPDLMGLFRRGLAGGKGLYQVMGQIVALLDGLGQQHFKFNVRRFVGTGKGGHQQLVVGLVRVFDVVQGLFQR